MRTLIIPILLICLCPAPVLGLAGKLAGPELGHRGGISQAQEKSVHRILEYMREELTFIEGNFINEFSYQRFGGTSAGVAAFIGKLKSAGLWELEIQFQDFGEQKSAFSLNQSRSGVLQLSINSARDDFLLKDFAPHLTKIVIPEGSLEAPAATDPKSSGVEETADPEPAPE